MSEPLESSPTGSSVRVSVLMPVYNEQPGFLRTAVHSILAQTLPDFELVLVDDGSDNADTLAVMSELESADPRILLYHEPHCGMTRSLNVGLARCRGEYICRQDSDDWSEPGRFAAQTAFMEANPDVGIVGTQACLHQERGERLWITALPEAPRSVLLDLEQRNPFFHGAVCFRRSLLQAAGVYRETLFYAQDYDLFWRFCERSKGANLPDALYHYRITRGSLSTVKSYEQGLEFLTIQRLAAMRRQGEEDYSAAVRGAEKSMDRQSGRYEYQLRQADRALLAGYPAYALRGYLRTLKQAPIKLIGWLKVLRWALFSTIPTLRQRLFAHR